MNLNIYYQIFVNSAPKTKSKYHSHFAFIGNCLAGRNTDKRNSFYVNNIWKAKSWKENPRQKVITIYYCLLHTGKLQAKKTNIISRLSFDMEQNFFIYAQFALCSYKNKNKNQELFFWFVHRDCFVLPT